MRFCPETSAEFIIIGCTPRYSELITAFDEYKDNIPENQAKIKQELNKILHDDEQTDKAFACIAKQKYNLEIAENKPENGLFSIEQYSVVKYYKTAETADTLERVHISVDKIEKIR